MKRCFTCGNPHTKHTYYKKNARHEQDKYIYLCHNCWNYFREKFYLEAGYKKLN